MVMETAVIFLCTESVSDQNLPDKMFCEWEVYHLVIKTRRRHAICSSLKAPTLHNLWMFWRLWVFLLTQFQVQRRGSYSPHVSQVLDMVHHPAC